MTFTIAWVLWILSFFVIEGVAIVKDRKDVGGSWPDTLSEHLRRWFRTDTNLGRTVFMVSFGVFAAWFGIHITTPPGYLF